MWGYDRGEDAGFTPHKTQDEHFQLFCMVLERGFAIHTGATDRLLIEFRLSDTGRGRYLPQVHAKRGVSFRIPERWLKLSDLYLYYDPSRETEIPELARYRPETGEFIPFDYEQEPLLDLESSEPLLPVVKLATLRGLHYIKDIACLQMYQLDYDTLCASDQALAAQLRQILVQKMGRFIEFADPWIQANMAERAAQAYLAGKAGRGVSATPPAPAMPRHTDSDPEFLSWE